MARTKEKTEKDIGPGNGNYYTSADPKPPSYRGQGSKPMNFPIPGGKASLKEEKFAAGGLVGDHDGSSAAMAKGGSPFSVASVAKGQK